MKYCKNCNAEHNDDARFCNSCGIILDDVMAPLAETVEAEVIEVEAVTETTEPEVVIATPQDEAIKIETTFVTPPVFTERSIGGVLAWSIVNLCLVTFDIVFDITFGATFVSLAFAIIALIFSIKAKASTNDEYYKIRKTNSLILNIAATALTVIGLMAYVIISIVTNTPITFLM